MDFWRHISFADTTLFENQISSELVLAFLNSTSSLLLSKKRELQSFQQKVIFIPFSGNMIEIPWKNVNNKNKRHRIMQQTN